MNVVKRHEYYVKSFFNRAKLSRHVCMYIDYIPGGNEDSCDNLINCGYDIVANLKQYDHLCLSLQHTAAIALYLGSSRSFIFSYDIL